MCIVHTSGLRQCLAHFLSEATKLEDTGSRETLYSVPTRSIEKLKSLAENGSIERSGYYD